MSFIERCPLFRVSVKREFTIEDDDYMEVREAVSDVLARWRHLAGALGVKPGQTSTIEASNRGAVGYEQRAERCRVLRPLTTYMTTHAHKRPMRMRSMPEVAAPELRQKSLLSNLVRFFWEWRTPRNKQPQAIHVCAHNWLMGQVMKQKLCM